MPIFAASTAAATCGCRDGSRSPLKVWRCAVPVPTAISRSASARDAAGGRRDESRRVVESLRLRKSGFAELGPGSLVTPRRRRWRAPHRCRAAPARGLADPHEPVVAHLLDLGLRVATRSRQRRQGSSPRRMQLFDVASEDVQWSFHASILPPPTDIRRPLKSP